MRDIDSKDIVLNKEKKYIKSVNRTVLFSALLLPVLSVILLGGCELIIYYFSKVNESGVGYIAAQLLSIIKDCVIFLSFLTAVCLFGSLVMSADGKKTLFSFFTLMFYAPVHMLVSVALNYILIVLGLHDMSISSFFSNLPVNLIFIGISSLIYILLVFCAYALFRLSKPMRVMNMSRDENYKRVVKIIFILTFIIRLIGFIADSVSGGISFSSINGVLSTLIVPLFSIALDLGASYFVFAVISNRLSDYADKLGVGNNPGVYSRKKKK